LLLLLLMYQPVLQRLMNLMNLQIRRRMLRD
jgi:hypothetical protein